MSEVIRLSGGEVMAVAEQLCEARAQAEADRGSYLRQLAAGRALLRPRQERADAPFPGACDLHVPLLRYATNALVAREHRALTGVTPIFYVEGRSPQEQEWAGAVEAFLQEQCRRQMRLAEVVRPLIKAANEDGTAVAYVRWKQRYARRLRYETAARDVVDVETGEVLAARGSVYPTRPLALAYDGPCVERIDITAVGTYPAANGSIQDSTGVYLRLAMTGNELLCGLISGDYDKAAVARLRAWGGEATAITQSDDARRGVGVSDASFGADHAFHNRVFEITEWYYSYAVHPDEPAEDWLITLHEPTRTVLRAIPNPWGHGERPIVPLHILPPKYGILGESLADLAGDPQRFITMILRLMVDAMALRIWPERYWGNGITPAEFARITKRENRGPGKDHKLNIDDINRAVRTLDIGVNPNEALPVLETMRQWAERATGVSDTMLGKAIGRPVTATEVEGMLQEGQEMVMDMTDSLSAGLTRIGELVLALDYEYSSHDSIEQLWALANPGATTRDPRSGLELPLTATLGLSGHYDVMAAGTTATANKAIRKQRAMELFAALRDDPFVNADPSGRRQYQLRKTLLVDGFDQRAPEHLIGAEDEAAHAINPQAAGAPDGADAQRLLQALGG